MRSEFSPHYPADTQDLRPLEGIAHLELLEDAVTQMSAHMVSSTAISSRRYSPFLRTLRSQKPSTRYFLHPSSPWEGLHRLRRRYVRSWRLFIICIKLEFGPTETCFDMSRVRKQCICTSNSVYYDRPTPSVDGVWTSPVVSRCSS